MARSRRKSKTPSGKGAFTLIELLVVIVILGLLMALLVPSLRGVWMRYNMTRCQSNLFHIYQAFRLRAADEAMGAKEAYAVAVWTTVLLPYLENDAGQFFCTETAEGDSTPGRSITEFVEFRSKMSWAPYAMYYTQLAPGPQMLKLSDTQWNTARSLGLFVWPTGQYILTNYPEYGAYVPDGQPHIYWLCMEDHPGSPADADFKDVMTRVTYDKSAGTVKLECISGGTAYTDHLMDKETGEVLFLASSYNANFNFSPAKTVTLDVGGVTAEPTSYGMNEYAIDKFTADGKLIRRGVGGAGGKILVLDYSRPVAYPDKDLWTDEVFNPDKSDVPRFARHFGMANVLFSDGSVRPERPADINPFAPTVAMKWWEP